jgi:hypothetical protein
MHDPLKIRLVLDQPLGGQEQPINLLISKDFQAMQPSQEGSHAISWASLRTTIIRVWSILLSCERWMKAAVGLCLWPEMPAIKEETSRVELW